jgi:hypothetical protein
MTKLRTLQIRREPSNPKSSSTPSNRAMQLSQSFQGQADQFKKATGVLGYGLKVSCQIGKYSLIAFSLSHGTFGDYLRQDMFFTASSREVAHVVVS